MTDLARVNGFHRDAIERAKRQPQVAMSILAHQLVQALERAEATERERDALQHIIECADTLLMRDVLRERDDLRQKRDSVGTLAVEEAIGRSKAEQRVAELEEALREIMEKGAYDADYEIARAALATSEQARKEDPTPPVG
jgi:hypothetical protein